LSVYLDASTLLPTLIEEPGSAAVDRFISGLDEEMIVSEFAAAEVASALSRLVRTGVMAPADAGERLADFDAWRGAAASDRRFDLMLRAPDALHIALCRRHDLNLVTMDHRMAQAAKALGVTVSGVE
jgi:predicted nucleic acid-binding protein